MPQRKLTLVKLDAISYFRKISDSVWEGDETDGNEHRAVIGHRLAEMFDRRGRKFHFGGLLAVQPVYAAARTINCLPVGGFCIPAVSQRTVPTATTDGDLAPKQKAKTILK